MRAATVEGSPKTPLPMIEFTTSATRLQRPMARRSSGRGGFADGDSISACVCITNGGCTDNHCDRGAALRAGLDSRGGCPHMVPFRPEVTLLFNSKVTSLQREKP